MASLSDLKAFVAVAQHGSFRAAADASGVTRSTLSHAVRGLEEDLALRLLNRTTRSVGPTEAGTRLLARLAPLLRDLDEMLRTAGGDEDAAGPLRITAIEPAACWLVRHVAPDLLRRHPRIALDIAADDRFVDIVAEGFDAGVRLREAVPLDMVAVPFGGAVRFLAVASPGYLDGHGAPATPDDLKRHRCIRHRMASGRLYRWEFAQGRDEVTVDVPGALTLDRNDVMVEAAVAGLGIAYVPERLARTALGEGRLRPVLEAWSPPVPGFCLYHPSRRHVPPALKAFIGALHAAERARGEAAGHGGADRG